MDNIRLIASSTVGSGGANNITFSSVPQTYTDLVVKISTKCSFDWLLCEFNGSGGTAYDQVNFRGDGSNPASGTQNDKPAAYATITGQNVTADVFGNAELYISNYTGSTFKTILGDGVTEANQTAAYIYLTTSVWENTAAITQIKLTKSDAGNFDEHSTAYLYGVSNTTAGTGGAKATGGYVTEDTNYFYHTFLTSGTFTPTQSLTADYLVVAGGGGGSNGGGGAGGLRSTVGTTGGGASLESPLSLTAQAYTVTVGAGGAGQNAGSLAGTNGSNSVFSTITSTAGGGAGAQVNSSEQNGKNGGSGGGTGFGRPGPSGTVGTGASGQGYDGGQAYSDQTTYTAGGGGGGAGAVGASVNSANGNGAAGGIGVSISTLATPTLTGISSYYAGGGGGASAHSQNKLQGAGGLGGGGAGSQYNTNSGTSNTGGGGGGRNDSVSNAGSGGSGIVIVRYAK